MGIIDGLKNIASGVYSIGKGVVKLVVGAFKLALLAVVCFIAGVYAIMEGIFEFAKKAYKKLKRTRPNTKPKGAGSITGPTLIKIINATDKEVANDIYLSDFEKEEAHKDLNEIADKYYNNEISGMQYIDGKNEEGKDDILDAEFFKSNALSSESQDKNVYRQFK